MLIEIIIVFLGTSLVCYVLFGGADFGAGILELLTPKEDPEIIANAIGPVWEANHVWLILVIVILFMGFPPIYTTLSTYLHIPLILLLLGIVLRGTAFTYMHYDAIQDRSSHIYNWTFKISSVLTPMFLGIVVGAAILGKIDRNADQFTQAFITPWFNGFCFSMGLFTVCLFTFLAAVYMIGETADPDERAMFVSAARKVNAATVVSGGLVFVTAEWYGLPLVNQFLNSTVSLTAIVLATFSLPFLWISLNRHKVLLSRLIAGFQAVIILFAWFWVQHPAVVHMADGNHLTFQNSTAPDSTMLQLLIALVVGSAIIFPFLGYLMKVFKEEQFKA